MRISLLLALSGLGLVAGLWIVFRVAQDLWRAWRFGQWS